MTLEGVSRRPGRHLRLVWRQDEVEPLVQTSCDDEDDLIFITARFEEDFPYALAMMVEALFIQLGWSCQRYPIYLRALGDISRELVKTGVDPDVDLEPPSNSEDTGPNINT